MNTYAWMADTAISSVVKVIIGNTEIIMWLLDERAKFLRRFINR